MEKIYYDGTKLLSMKDINGNKPELYLVTSNRTAGKTTYFVRKEINAVKKKGEKFAVLVRHGSDLKNVENRIFKDVNSLFFPDMKMTSAKGLENAFVELRLNDEPCGYAIAINNARKIKEVSHLLSDVSSIFFDEFQAMDSHYCVDEVNKLADIHTSLARGHGEQRKYLPVYMCSNTVSIINPYFTKLGISHRLREDTKFLRGDGFVLEQNYNESAAKAIQKSGFARAFSSDTEDKYFKYASQAVYLEDNKAFISKPSGRNFYKATIKYNGKNFGVREFLENGIIYVDQNPDMTFPVKIATTTEDHNINYVMLRRSSVFISDLRFYFEKGVVRFENLGAKEAFLKTISY